MQNKEEDQRSNLERVQDKYAHIAEEMEARSRRSVAGGSVGRLSQFGSRASFALNKERLNDFNQASGAQPQMYNTLSEKSEKLSCTSGLESEIDEWAALNKLQVLRLHQEAEAKKENEQKKKEIIREELKKQQAEFDAKKKQEIAQLRADFAKECEARSKREIAIEKARAEAKASKISEINRWRI